MLTVYVVSGGTGETVERVAHAAPAQFENVPASLVRRGEIRTPEQVRRKILRRRSPEGDSRHAPHLMSAF